MYYRLVFSILFFATTYTMENKTLLRNDSFRNTYKKDASKKMTQAQGFIEKAKTITDKQEQNKRIKFALTALDQAFKKSSSESEYDNLHKKKIFTSNPPMISSPSLNQKHQVSLCTMIDDIDTAIHASAEALLLYKKIHRHFNQEDFYHALNHAQNAARSFLALQKQHTSLQKYSDYSLELLHMIYEKKHRLPSNLSEETLSNCAQLFLDASTFPQSFLTDEQKKNLFTAINILTFLDQDNKTVNDFYNALKKQEEALHLLTKPLSKQEWTSQVTQTEELLQIKYHIFNQYFPYELSEHTSEYFDFRHDQSLPSEPFCSIALSDYQHIDAILTKLIIITKSLHGDIHGFEQSLPVNYSILAECCQQALILAKPHDDIELHSILRHWYDFSRYTTVHAMLTRWLDNNCYWHNDLKEDKQQKYIILTDYCVQLLHYLLEQTQSINYNNQLIKHKNALRWLPQHYATIKKLLNHLFLSTLLCLRYNFKQKSCLYLNTLSTLHFQFKSLLDHEHTMNIITGHETNLRRKEKRDALILFERLCLLGHILEKRAAHTERDIREKQLKKREKQKTT